MADTNKIIFALLLISLLATVIGSYLVFENVANINAKMATRIIIIHDEGPSSGKASVTILAPIGASKADSAQAKINING